MKDRLLRLKAIKKVIKGGRIASQEELLGCLQAEGFEVTQATLSRDLKLMKVGKASDGNGGYVYTVPDDETEKESEQLLIRDFLRGYVSIEFSGNIVVIKTFGGHGNSVANALDAMNLHEILGTVAGENCIFACLREGVSGNEFIRLLKERIPELEV
ncbi:MAG: ArgR family transcriptional regulator [Treponema sp.]|nr:ArgR family transcriptional regulator [Treponema sp.]